MDDNWIAIVGVAARFPGAPAVADFWSLLVNEREGLTTFQPHEISPCDHDLRRRKNYVPVNGIISDVENFDAGFFGYSQTEASSMDPQHRLFLEVAWHALESAGLNSAQDRAIGVYASSSRSTYYLNSVFPWSNPREKPLEDLRDQLNNEKDHLANKVAYKLRLTGAAVNVQTACSSSLVAVHHACHALLLRECNACLVGAASIKVPYNIGYLYAPQGIASIDGHCRAFDKSASGTVSGDGVGAVVLKRYSDAVQAGDQIVAIILGSAINNDADRKVGYSAPSVDGQAEVISRAYSNAGVTPRSASYIEAHGTGTPLGDPIEIRALARVFGDSSGQYRCGIGSVKTNIGHLDAASGLAGLIKIALSLYHRKIPASLHFEDPNPEAHLEETPFYVCNRTKNWTASERRIAGVSSFGMGGTNCHVVLAETPEFDRSEDRPRDTEVVALLVSARSPATLRRYKEELADYIASHAGHSLPDIAHTLRLTRTQFACREAVFGITRAEIVDRLRQHSSLCNRPAESTTAIVQFSGENASSFPGAADLYRSCGAFREALDRIDAQFRDETGHGCREALIGNIDLSTETDSILMAAVTFSYSYALSELLQSCRVRPRAVFGSGLGELIALAVTGSLSLADAVRAVSYRSRVMFQTPIGRTIIVMCSGATLEAVGEHHGRVSVGETYDLGEYMLSGPAAVMDSVISDFDARGVPWRSVSWRLALRSALQNRAAALFAEYMVSQRLEATDRPVFSATLGRVIGKADFTAREYWRNSVVARVNVAQALETFRDGSGELPIELSSTRGLLQVSRRVDSSDSAHERWTLVSAAKVLDAVHFEHAMIRLWEMGKDMAFATKGTNGARPFLPSPRLDRNRCWIEPAGRLGSELSLTPRLYTSCAVAVSQSAWRISRDRRFSRSILICNAGRAELSRLLLDVADATEEVLEVDYSEASCGRFKWSTLRPPSGRFASDHISPDELPLRVIFAHATPDDLMRLDEPLMVLKYIIDSLGAGTSSARFKLFLVSEDARQMFNYSFCALATGIDGFFRVLNQEDRRFDAKHCRVEGTIAQNMRSVRQFIADSVDGRAVIATPRGFFRESLSLLRAPRANGACLAEGGVYIVTGVGKIGLALSSYLASRLKAKVVLLSRGLAAQHTPGSPPFEPRSNQETLRSVLGANSLIQIRHVDYNNIQELRQCVLDVNQNVGFINGVFHTAGITSGDTLASVRSLRDEHFGRQFEAKVRSLLNLVNAMAGLEPEFIMAFSSLAAILGGARFSAYSAANAALNGLCIRLAASASKTRFLSVCWDGWKFEGDSITSSLGHAVYDAAFHPDEAMGVIELILNSGINGVVAASKTDLSERYDTWVEQTAPPELCLRGFEADGPSVTPVSLREAVGGIWQKHLGLGSYEDNDDFLSLGGDSLLALHILSDVREVFEVDIDIGDFYETLSFGQFWQSVAAKKNRSWVNGK